MKMTNWRMGVVGVVVVAIITVVVYFEVNRACSGMPGVITEKSFIPAHDERTMILISVGKALVPNWITRHVPDRWYFDLDRAGDICDNTVSVEESVYDQYSVGSKYP